MRPTHRAEFFIGRFIYFSVHDRFPKSAIEIPPSRPRQTMRDGHWAGVPLCCPKDFLFRLMSRAHLTPEHQDIKRQKHKKKIQKIKCKMQREPIVARPSQVAPVVVVVVVVVVLTTK